MAPKIGLSRRRAGACCYTSFLAPSTYESRLYEKRLTKSFSKKKKKKKRDAYGNRREYGVSLRRTLRIATREKKTVSARLFRYRTRMYSRLTPPRLPRRPPSSRPEASERVRRVCTFFLIIKTVNTTSERDLRSRIRCPARKTGATPLAASFSSLPRRRRREESLPRVRLEKFVSSPPRRVLFIQRYSFISSPPRRVLFIQRYSFISRVVPPRKLCSWTPTFEVARCPRFRESPSWWRTCNSRPWRRRRRTRVRS